MQLAKNLVLLGYNVYVTSLKAESEKTDFIKQQESVSSFIKHVVDKLDQ